MKTYHFITIIILFFFSCSKQQQTIELAGNAQGTTYKIIYIDDDYNNYQTSVDSIFKVIDKSMSLWDSTSLISKINSGDTTVEVDIHFATVFRKAEEISEKTDGAFDITVGPLVQAWGFGLSKATEMDSAKVDSLRAFVNYKNVKLEDGKILKTNPAIKIDFNAIAQGYTVDVIGEFLENKKIKNYLIELGGELKAKGTKADGKNWRVGIDKPIDNSNEQTRELQIIIELKNKSLATSGNYRKFYERDGQKYSHTIDPATGYSVNHNLLSATVIADDCMTADAYATALMVMGPEKAQKFLSLRNDLEGYLIYDQSGNMTEWLSPGFKKMATD